MGQRRHLSKGKEQMGRGLDSESACGEGAPPHAPQTGSLGVCRTQFSPGVILGTGLGRGQACCLNVSRGISHQNGGLSRRGRKWSRKALSASSSSPRLC